MKVPVLLVDDDPDDILALRVTLESPGLEIVSADSGEEALRLLLRRDFALVVMDLAMPRMNGFETGNLIRERDRCRGLPIVILTGFDEDGARGLPGWRPGGFELMRKPIQPEILRARVAELTARWRPIPSAGISPSAK